MLRLKLSTGVVLAAVIAVLAVTPLAVARMHSAAACIRATAIGVTASTATRAARMTPVESFNLSI